MAQRAARLLTGRSDRHKRSRCLGGQSYFSGAQIRSDLRARRPRHDGLFDAVEKVRDILLTADTQQSNHRVDSFSIELELSALIFELKLLKKP
jgi:hypothetical protein